MNVRYRIIGKRLGLACGRWFCDRSATLGIVVNEREMLRCERHARADFPGIHDEARTR